MAIQTDPRSTNFNNEQGNREDVVYARHQWFGFALFGALSCIAAVVYLRWDPSTTGSRWLWIVCGPLIGIVAIARAQTIFGEEGVDRDPAPYVGIFVGATIGSLVVAVLSYEGWVLPSVFFVIALFMSFMAWLEQSGIGMSAAVAVAAVSVAMAIADLGDSVAMVSFSIGLMLLSGALALAVCARPTKPPVVRRPSGSTL